MIERRSERRLKVLKEGRVLLGDSRSLGCIVRDISPRGARLEFRIPDDLPSEFRLNIVNVDLTVPAVLVWRRQGECGVRFVGVGTAGAVDNSPLA